MARRHDSFIAPGALARIGSAGVAALLSLAVGLGPGCLGGQGGDEGLIELPSPGPGLEPPSPAAPGLDPTNAQPPGEHEGPAASPEPTRNPTLDGDDVSYECGADEWPGPDAERRFHSCSGPTTEGPWSCLCGNGDTGTSTAEVCNDALQATCGIKQDPPDGPRDHCSAGGDDAGTCWRDPQGGWSCRCGDPAGDSALGHVPVDTCETALFQTCAAACEAPLGRCEPLRDGDAQAYHCDCALYGAVARRQQTPTCQGAVEAACNPEAPAGDQTCNSYAGFCDPDGDGLACQCLDGATVPMAASERGDRSCPDLLGDACGPGEPPADRSCRRARGATVGRCVDLGEGIYHCRCGLDPSAAVTTAGLPEDIELLQFAAEQTTTDTAGTCLEAVAVSCPQAIETTADDRLAACSEHAGCQDAVTVDGCTERISDACALCTQEATASDGTCAALDRCAMACGGLIPPPETSAACRTLLESQGSLAPGPACFCDMCLDTFAACMVDPGCAEILTCAGETGCRDAGCYAADTCMEVIDRWGVSSDSTSMAQAVGGCDAAPTCAAL